LPRNNKMYTRETFQLMRVKPFDKDTQYRQSILSLHVERNHKCVRVKKRLLKITV